MAMIGHLLNQSITIENPSGTRDKNGRAALGSVTTVDARFQRTNKTIVTEDRERDPIDGIVFVAADTTIEKGARIVYDSENYRLIRKDSVIGRNGDVNHYELLVQLWSYAA